MKTNKIFKSIKSLTLLSALLLVFLIGCSQSSTQALTATEYLDLGHQYLSEQNYEEAILAFEKAIEIDPKLVDAYVGLATVYTELGDFDAAYAAITLGLEQVPGDATLTALLSELESMGDSGSAWSGASEGDGSLNAINAIDVELENFAAFLDNLEETEEITLDIITYLIEQEYIWFNEEVGDALLEAGVEAEDDLLYAHETAGGTMAFYYLSDDRDPDDFTRDLDWGYMLYYGDMVDGQRQGEGQWMRMIGTGEGTNCFYAVCTWVDDQPTGQAYCRFDRHRNFDGVSLACWDSSIWTGTLVNGLWDGTLVCESNEYYSFNQDGSAFQETTQQLSTYTMSQGFYVPIGYYSSGEAIYSDPARGYGSTYYEHEYAIGLAGYAPYSSIYC